MSNIRKKLLIFFVLVGVGVGMFLLAEDVEAQSCGGTVTKTMHNYTCPYNPYWGYYCSSSTWNWSDVCEWHGNIRFPKSCSECNVLEPDDLTCTANASGCTITYDNSGGVNSQDCNCCFPSCSTPYCGQSDDCGGTCSNEDDNWNWTSDTRCGGTRACGQRWDTERRFTNPCRSYDVWDVVSYNDCGNCRECGPNYGSWSSCSAGTFERCRSVQYDCSANGTECEACRGEIYGTFFDASEVSDCSNIAGQPKVSGVTVTATAQTNHSGSYSDTTAVDGTYSINGTNLRVPEDYLMSFSGLGNNYDSIPKLMCDFGVNDNPSTWETNLATQAETEQWRVGLWKVYGPWFQVQGGEVYAEGGIESIIPGTCGNAGNWQSCGNIVDSGGSYTDQTPLVRKVYNTDGSRDYAGVAIIGSGQVDVGEASNAVVSHTSWEAVDSSEARTADYNYFDIATSRVDRAEWNGLGKPAGSTSGIYTSTAGPGGSTTIDNDWDVGGGGSDETIVVVHQGDILITSNMNVEKGSYLAIITSGNITIADNVTQVEGVYIADGSITVESTGDTSTDQQFIGEGTFVGWSGVNLNRDRGMTNNSEPPQRFIFRQDLVVNAPDSMRSSEVTWQEIRP